ncbi:carboxypeptidase regulatory-like domain-containing protein [Silvibacterium sp.]|uniref:carboxypeptidase regulatory-like domain-containing protein n=1 Tax=Silvibacterium sp. TaxID=1964179 RepID=UPI0039E6F00C
MQQPFWSQYTRRILNEVWHSRILVLGLIFFFSLIPQARAQLTTADITGVVTDPQGNVLPGATVTLTSLATHESRQVTADAQGAYLFSLLLPGHYSIRVEATGFRTFSIPDLGVEAGDRGRADAKMVVGAASETVQVTAATPLLQADNATVSSSVTAGAVVDLPLNGRNFIQEVQLVPGANEGPGNGLTSGQRPDDRRSTNGLSVNGQDDVLNNEIIDGIDNNERIIGSIGVKPSVDAIQEISVQTNNYAPEIGRTAGGVIDVITKSGSNAFHGSLFEFFRNDVLDARSYFATTSSIPQKPELRQNQFGGSLGGPIFRNKTFFFGSYEGFRLVQAINPYTSTVPDATNFDSINSIGGSSPTNLINAAIADGALPAVNPTPGSGGTYTVDPIALNYLKLFPAPNAAGTNSGVTNNYVSGGNKTQYSTTVDARVDHSFNTNNQLYARFTYNNVSSFNPAQLPVGGPNAISGVIPGGGRYNFSGDAADVAYGYQLNFTHIFTPHLILELKAGYTRINNLSTPLNYGVNAATEFGFPSGTNNFNNYSSGLTVAGISNYEDLGDGAYVPLQDIDNTFQYAGNVSYTVGPHNMKMGASLIRRQARNVQSASAVGAYSFGLSTDTSGYSVTDQNTNVLASMLIGAFTSPTRIYNLDPPDYRAWEPSVYWQDFWKPWSNVTIVYGARYDVFTPFTDAHNHISNFNWPLAQTLSASNIDSALEVANYNGASATAGVATDYSNFAPRIGFAVTVKPGTVVRGGFGMSYFPGNYTSNADLKNVPWVSAYQPSCESTLAYYIISSHGASATPVCGTDSQGSTGTQTLSQGLPIPTAPFVAGQAPNLASISGLSFVAENPKLRQGVVYQYNLLVERQIGAAVATIGYVGEVGNHQPEVLNNINLPSPAGPAAAASQTYILSSVLPNVATVGYYDSEGVSAYNALQASLEQRLSHGFTLNANYTWSHVLDDFSGLSEEGDQGYGNADPHNLRKTEYGNGDNDIRNRFVLQSTYAIPYGQNLNGFRKQVLGGWQFNEIFAIQSGKDFSVENSTAGGCVVPTGYAAATTGNCAHPYSGPEIGSPGNDRPDIIAPFHIHSPGRAEWFNTSAFEGQTIGTVSNQERNQLYGPAFRHVDISLFKNFPIHESLNLQFRAEFFNLTNTVSLFMPNNNSGDAQLGNGSFGQLTNVDPNYTPRQIQFALRATF